MSRSHGVDWTEDKLSRVKELSLRGCPVMDIAKKISREFGIDVSYDAAQHARRRFGYQASLIAVDPNVKVYKEITIPDGNYMVGVDAHAPYYSEMWVNRMIAVADKFKIKMKIHGGDLLDMDFAKRHYDTERTLLKDEIDFSSPLFQALDYFDKIYLIKGNHEARVGISTDNRVQAENLFGLYGKEVWTKKFVYSTYDKINIGERWMVVHPKSYSQISGSTSVRLGM